MSLHNKRTLAKFCLDYHVPTPHTTLLSPKSDIDAIAREYNDYPVFIKYPMNSAAMGTIKIDSEKQLRETISRIKTEDIAAEVYPLIQVGVRGHQIATQAVFQKGKMLSFHMYKNIVEYPPESGSGVVRQSVFHDEVQKLMEKIGALKIYDGILAMDFLIDQNTGKPYLIDVNPRVPLGFSNADHAEAQIPEAYAHAINQEEFTSQKFEAGIKSTFFLSHITWLLASLQSPKLSRFNVLKKFFSDREDTYSEFVDHRDSLPLIMLPFVFVAVMSRKGENVMEKYLGGSNFTDDTYRVMVS
jgi:predicted ATP-grasp superfamily ATP-dependent carboligase